MNEPLPVNSPLGGVVWIWIVPTLLFAVTGVATWLLYRHFAKRKPDDS